MRKPILRVAYAFFLSIWLAAGLGGVQKAQPEHVVSLTPDLTPDLTKEQWRQDLRYLAKELSRRHKNAFHTVSKERFESAVAELDAAIPSLQEHQILVGLRRIVAMIGDAHTALAPPENFHRYPLTLYWFGSDLRVLRTTQRYRRALGARVVGVGTLPLAQVVARVDTLVPHENDQFVRYSDVSYMPLAEVLQALKVVPDLERAEWTFSDDKGERFSLELEAVAQDAKVEWLTTLREVPFYRQRSSELMWFTILSDSQTAYLNLKVYPDGDTFKRVAAALWKQVDETRPKRLVIDVRQSYGGDFIKFQNYLLKDIKQRSDFRKPGSLYVIIGRSTVSASMVNAIELRKEQNAVIVGEPTGSKPNNYSENDHFTLPNSHLEISYSTRYYKLQAEDTASLIPDKLIEPVWDTYTAGRDSAMEWILAQPLSK